MANIFDGKIKSYIMSNHDNGNVTSRLEAYRELAEETRAGRFGSVYDAPQKSHGCAGENERGDWLG